MNENSINEIHIDQLRLDPENPRLPVGIQGGTQELMLEYIATTTAIEDLVNAIGSNGYFPGEPVIAYQKGDSCIVIEGNRRLVAVKLLIDPYILNNPNSRLLEIVRVSEHKPEKIPVVIRENREDVLPYLGFRHITGVKQWEPLSKARYMKQLLDTTPGDVSLRERYKLVGDMIGSRTGTIRRNLDALAVYELIDREDFYSIDGLDGKSIKFAVLSTAIADESISNFVGITVENGQGDIEYREPIVDSGCLDKKAVKELTQWLFEPVKDGKARVAESREIRKLSRVVGDAQALSAFKGGSTLEYAFRITEGADE